MQYYNSGGEIGIIQLHISTYRALENRAMEPIPATFGLAEEAGVPGRHMQTPKEPLAKITLCHLKFNT